MHERRHGLRLTCGVVVTDGAGFVMGDAGGWWDLPKGRPGSGEEHAAAAARELAEETAIRVSPGDLHPLGLYHYRPGTDLALFLAHVGALPDPRSLACAAMVDDGDGPPFPEMSGFAIVPWESLETHATGNMSRCLRLSEPLVRARLAAVPRPIPCSWPGSGDPPPPA